VQNFSAKKVKPVVDFGLDKALQTALECTCNFKITRAICKYHTAELSELSYEVFRDRLYI